MINEYRLLLVSSVGERDGMAVELARNDGTRVAEVFEDEETGQRTVTLFEQGVSLDLVEWLLREATSRL